MNKTALLFSGGYDSAAVWFKVKEPDYTDLVFIDYGQLYLDKELEKAKLFAERLGKELRVVKIAGTTDMKDRNIIFIRTLLRLGYTNVYLGCRNVLPIFDKYKDSNWWRLKWIFGDLVKLPIVGWNKRKIIKYLRKQGYNYDNFYNCYNNNSDYKTCDCVNCKELQRIL